MFPSKKEKNFFYGKSICKEQNNTKKKLGKIVLYPSCYTYQVTELATGYIADNGQNIIAENGKTYNDVMHFFNEMIRKPETQ